MFFWGIVGLDIYCFMVSLNWFRRGSYDGLEVMVFLNVLVMVFIILFIYVWEFFVYLEDGIWFYR